MSSARRYKVIRMEVCMEVFYIDGLKDSEEEYVERSMQYNKGEILDGHHRWSACYIAAGPNKGLTKVTFVDAAAEIAIPMLRSIGNAFGNEQKS